VSRAHHYDSEVCSVRWDASVVELARKLEEYAVGSVVVVDDAGQPLGLVTDRDLTCRVIAPGLPPAATTAGEVMSKPLITGQAEDALERIVDRMRVAGVRRIPVLEDGRLVGIVSFDDVLAALARELDDLGEAARAEVMHARRRRRRRRQLEESLWALRRQTERAGGHGRDFATRELEGLRERLRRLLH